MPRLPRIDFPGLFHHVIARGIEKRSIFRSNRDYSEFADRLGRILQETKTLCYAWALMPNHLHLLLQTASTRISRVMQKLLTGYAVSFNLRYQRAGHLFQNRYKDIICQEDPYFLELIRYIALNPVRAGIVRSPSELAVYPWTSHSALMGTLDRPWQVAGKVLERFGPTLRQARANYELFVMEAWSQKRQDQLEGGGLIRSWGGGGPALQAIRSGEAYAYDLRLLGDSAFVEETLRKAKDGCDETPIPKSINFEKVLDLIADLTGEDPHYFSETGQRRALSDAKAMAVYAGVVWFKQSVTGMGKQLVLSTSTASRAFERGQRLAHRFELKERLNMQSCNYVP
ncbi:MAG: transposase [Elusimicrobiota bacterium]|jgi:REP element-mobilizing transposase RayT